MRQREVGIMLMVLQGIYYAGGDRVAPLYQKSCLKAKTYSHIWDAQWLSLGLCCAYHDKQPYSEGDEWNRECLEYVQGNIRYVQAYLEERIPVIKMIVPEASFLIFSDCRGLGFDSTEDLNRFFIREGRAFPQ